MVTATRPSVKLTHRGIRATAPVAHPLARMLFATIQAEEIPCNAHVTYEHCARQRAEVIARNSCLVGVTDAEREESEIRLLTLRLLAGMREMELIHDVIMGLPELEDQVVLFNTKVCDILDTTLAAVVSLQAVVGFLQAGIRRNSTMIDFAYWENVLYTRGMETRLTRRITGVITRVDQVNTRINNVDDKIDQISKEIYQKIDQVDQKIDQVSKDIYQKIDQVSKDIFQKIDQVDQKIDQVGKEIYQKIDLVNTSIGQKMDVIIAILSPGGFPARAPLSSQTIQRRCSF